MFDNLSAVKDAVKSCHPVTWFFSILTPPLEAWPSVKMASIMEGPLSKWTNVMKGWQYRWFVLDYNAGLLSYYTSKDKMMRGSRRGCVRLRGAVIGIDDEDDSTFTITVDQKTFHFQGESLVCFSPPPLSLTSHSADSHVVWSKSVNAAYGRLLACGSLCSLFSLSLSLSYALSCLVKRRIIISVRQHKQTRTSRHLSGSSSLWNLPLSSAASGSFAK
uniref:PH domain-containing protein n=1 Tax=Hucho hucho TaxID=62062 RepID=A0A4W5NK72_9TELE